MNAGSPDFVYAAATGSVAGAIALVVVLGLLRKSVPQRFPGGPGRYALALIVQASAFIVPVPIVALSLVPGGPFGPPVFAPITAPYGTHILAGLAVGYGFVLLLRALPGSGPLMSDLARARLEAALARTPPYSTAA
jgi:hypothetical protein